jgi:hypothetical protein
VVAVFADTEGAVGHKPHGFNLMIAAPSNKFEGATLAGNRFDAVAWIIKRQAKLQPTRRCALGGVPKLEAPSEQELRLLRRPA